MDYYQLLGIDKNAAREEITRAYRKEIFKNHPDRNAGKENEKLLISILLNEAYEVLTDDVKKKDYDKNIENIESKNEKQKKEERYLNYMKNRIKEHIMKFDNNYYSNLHFNNMYETFKSYNEIKEIIEKQTGIEFNSRFLGFDIESTDYFNWAFFCPASIYKREYCIVLNSFENKIFYVLLINKKEYDLLFKDRNQYHGELYFNGEHLKYKNNILDKYIKCIVHYK